MINTCFPYICAFLLSGPINHNLGELRKLGIGVNHFKTNLFTRNSAYGAIEFNDLKENTFQALAQAGLPKELAGIFITQLLHESRHMTSKHVRKVINNRGRTVYIGGYVQMDSANRRKYKKLGLDVSNPNDAPFILVDHMLNLMKRTWKQTPDHLKEKMTVKQLFVNALKRYNGNGYATLNTIKKTLQDKGSSGSKENRDYVVQIMAGFTELTMSEIRGIGTDGKIRRWRNDEEPSYTDTKMALLIKFRMAEGVHEAIERHQLCPSDTYLYIKQRVLDTGVFNALAL